MALYTKHVFSAQQRWSDVTITCGSWPSNETVQVVLPIVNIGDVVDVYQKNPVWRSQIRAGINATTAFNATRTAFSHTDGHIECRAWCNSAPAGWTYYQYDGDLFLGHSSVWTAPNAPPSSIDSQTADEALTRAIKDARAKQSHFRGGNFLAELADTLRGIRNPAKGFRGLLDTYHRNARKRVKRAVGRRTPPVTQNDFRRLERDAPDVARAAQRALGDSWLEANFGWQPLLSDVVGSYQALRRLTLRTPQARFYGRAENETAPTYASSTASHHACTMHFSVRTNVKYDVTFYGAVKIEGASKSSQAIEEFGVRARDFVPAVWEAIPYSFLIDYFTNIGDLIELASFPNSDLAWMSRTYRNHSIRSTERVAVTVNSGPAYPATGAKKLDSFQPPAVIWDRHRVVRSVSNAFVTPKLRFEIPGSKNWRKWLNVAALARLRTL